MDVACRAGLRAGRANLRKDFVAAPGTRAAFADLVRVVAGPEMALQGVLLHPPSQQLLVTLAFLVDGPVELGCEVVHPAGLQPLPRIGIQFFEGIEPLHVFGIARPPDAEGTDTELHPGLGAGHGTPERVDEQVDILPPPVVARERTTLGSVALPAAIVGKGDGLAAAALGIGIEVVVEVDAIDVIALHDVEHHADGALAYGGLAGIHPQRLAVALHQLRALPAEVVASE